MLGTFKSLPGHIADLHVALKIHEEKLEPNYHGLTYMSVTTGGPGPNEARGKIPLLQKNHFR